MEHFDKKKLISNFKYFSFEGLTIEEIILKFDTVLAQKEEQIAILNNDFLTLNNKVTLLSQNNDQLMKEKRELDLRIVKLKERLSQEESDKVVLLNDNKKLDMEIIHIKNQMKSMTVLDKVNPKDVKKKDEILSKINEKLEKEVKKDVVVKKDGKTEKEKEKEKVDSLLPSDNIDYVPFFD